MHYIDVSDGTTISCPKYIVTKLESFYQVKILEKKEIIYVLEILIMLQHLLHVNQTKLLYYSWWMISKFSFQRTRLKENLR